MDKDLTFAIADVKYSQMEHMGVGPAMSDVKISLAAYYMLVLNKHGLPELEKHHKSMLKLLDTLMKVHRNGV